MFHQRHFAIVSVGALIVIAGCSAGDGTRSATTDSAEAQTVERVAPSTEAWRQTMHQTSAPRGGCFEASFPSTEWVEISCAEPPAYRSALPRITGNREEVVGNGSDYVAQAPSGHVFSSVVGSFPTVKGVTSEKSAGVSAFGNGGILGANEYTVQVNTNFYKSAACGSYAGCLAWQQYVLSTNTPVSLTSSGLTNKTEVFIEYWLINYGSSSRARCPSGFINGGADEEGPGVDCVQNTPATAIVSGQLPITDLADLTMSASVTAGGQDSTTVTYNGKAYTATVADSYTEISAGWTEAEFNVFGNAGGSRADFNSGSSVTVKLAVNDASTTAPTCIPPSSIAGTTGETNNLTAGSCTGTSGASPYIEFTESN
jgi:hypothetical protein